MKNNNQPDEVDNLPNPIFSKKNVGVKIQRFFFNSYCTDFANRAVFSYTFDKETVSTEKVGLNSHKLCVSKGSWFFGNTFAPVNIFIFFSALEAIAFANVSAHKYNLETSLFISLGVKPSREQISKIKSDFGFKKAKYHTVFSNDLLGNVYDCKVSLWLDDNDCRFYLYDTFIKIISNAKTPHFKSVEIDRKTFKYAQFILKFVKKKNLKVHKPNGDYNTFLDLITAKKIP